MSESKFLIDNEQLMSEWCWDLNDKNNINPDKLLLGSSQKVWWQCNKCKYKWIADVRHRYARGQGCPVCANRKIIAGYNDLATTHPQVIQFWNYERNTDIKPDSISYGSIKKVWWKCSKGHDYLMSIAHKIGQNANCPICSGKIVLVGFNDLATVKPEIAKEWNYDKNGDLLPTQVTYGSNKKVWWKCGKCRCEWMAIIGGRSQGIGCPVCANRTIVEGINDLATCHPEIAQRWHPTLNKLKPTQVASQSNKKVWWCCEKYQEHYFEAKIYHMVNDTTQCPICANQKVLKGYNDLTTTHPELIKEWDYQKNTIKPEDVTYGTPTKVWWECENGHSWKSTIASRAGTQKTGCPICKKELFVSFPEKTISYYLKKCLVVEETKKIEWLGNSELDIFIPELNLAIEYDGQAWHKDIQRDLKKDILCEEHGIKLIRIREPLCPNYESSAIKIVLNSKDKFKLGCVVNEIIMFINQNYNLQININVDIESDYYEILSEISTIIKSNSVFNSSLINEWNYDKNGKVLPETISLGSDRKVWWKCEKGHEWAATVASRSGHQKCGCPYCAGLKVVPGWNDLETLHPEIASSWDCEKNYPVLPSEIRPQTNKKYWWKCDVCGNSWLSSASQRIRGRGCPKCGRRKTEESHYKKVLCVETNEIFNSISAAEKHYNLSKGTVGNCCRGIQKTGGGKHWKFIEKD